MAAGGASGPAAGGPGGLQTRVLLGGAQAGRRRRRGQGWWENPGGAGARPPPAPSDLRCRVGKEAGACRNDSEDEARLRERALRRAPQAGEAAWKALRHLRSSGPGSLKPKAVRLRE